MHSKVLMRRANVLAYAGRHDAALDDLARAVTDFRRTGDDVWEARALNLRAFVRIARAQFSEAEPDLDRALELHPRGGSTTRCWSCGTTWRSCAYFRGDVPGALAAFAEVAEAHGDDRSHAYLELVLDRAHVLLVAGLSDEALAVVEDAAAWVTHRPRVRADLLSCGRRPSWGRAGRTRRWRPRGRPGPSTSARGGTGGGPAPTSSPCRRASSWVGGPGERRSPSRSRWPGTAPRTPCWPTSWPVARSPGRTPRPPPPTSRAPPRVGATAAPSSRSTAWLARALELEVRGGGRVLDAVGRGLDALAEHRATLGSPELRALTAIHSSDLATLAVRHALGRGPRALVRWSDRARAASLAEPVPAPQDPAIDALLATIRGLSHRIAEEHDPAAVQALVRERGQHERAVRLAWAATPGTGGQAVSVADAELVEHLDDRVLVQLVDVDGTLHAVVVRDGRWRTVAVGPTERATAAVDAAMYGLRTATRGRPVRPGPAGGPAGGGAARRRRTAAPGRSPGRRLAAGGPAGRPVGAAAGPARPAGGAHPVGHRLGAGPRRAAAVVARGLRGRPGPAHRGRRGRPGRGAARRRPPC